MKTKSIFNLFLSLIAMTFVFTSCGSDDSGDGGGGVTSISLTSNLNGGLVGEQFTFTVKDNSNNDVTANAEITANGTTISSPHTFTTTGVYNVVATYSGKTSNALSITIDDETSISIIYTPNTNITTVDMVDFRAVNNLGNDVTSSTTFSIGGTDIANPYQFPTAGSFDVMATYGALTATETIMVGRGFTKKALLEDFTGTWCPNCPPAAAAVASVSSSNENVFGVAYHDGFTSYPDPMEIPETGYWSSYYNVTGFPTVYVNGPDTRWDFPGVAQVNTELEEVATLGLALDAAIVGGQLSVEVKVAFNTVPTEEVKLMLYLVEDNVTTSSPQAGSSAGAGYVHRDVLREVYTDQLGDVIPAGSISLTSDYVRNFTVGLPSNIDDMSELKVIAFVRNTYVKTFTDYFGTVHTNSPHYDIYNVQEVHMGDSIDFD